MYCKHYGQHTATKIPFMYSFSGDCAASVPISICMCPWASYIFPGSIRIFPCSRIGRPILEIYKYLTDIWVYELGDRTLYFCFGSKEAAHFHFWEYIYGNQTLILDSHRPFNCTVNRRSSQVIPTLVWGMFFLLPGPGRSWGCRRTGGRPQLCSSQAQGRDLREPTNQLHPLLSCLVRIGNYRQLFDDDLFRCRSGSGDPAPELTKRAEQQTKVVIHQSKQQWCGFGICIPDPDPHRRI